MNANALQAAAPSAPRIVQWGLRVLGAVAPSLADRLILRLYITPRRRPPRDPAAGSRRGELVVDGERLAVWTWGQGPTVLLVHGWSGDATHMGAFVAPLVAAGRRVVAVDLPAHGRSTGKTTTLPRMARAVRGIADALGGVDAVVAHSLGATAVALAVERGLALERLVMVAPARELHAFTRVFAAALRLDGARTAAILEGVRLELGGDYRGVDVLSYAARQTTPLLVVHDPGDREVPYEHGADIAAAWPGAALQPAAGLGHRRILRDPAVVAAATAFVDAPARARLSA
jgi:pimeloyl-ACP methyl ester carboxylesterase